jgi:hypothetical protein
MTEVSIQVLDVLPEPFAVAPHLLFRLRLSESSGAVVHALALRAQIMVHPQRRPYGDAERAGLVDLFGGSERWSQTLKPFLWAHASTLVQGFQGVQEVDLPVPCTYDFEVTASKYLQALREGEVPLELLFGGTVFTRAGAGLSVEQLPWSLQASYRMPVATWRALMDQWFPGSGWIRLDREALDALVRYRSARGLTSWEQTVTALLEGQEVASP